MADQLLQLPTQLHKAAHAADATAIANALAESPHATASTDNLEQTPLVLAVRARAADDDAVQNLANCTKLLCDAGSDVNHFDKNGESPLHLAVMSGGGVPKTAVVKVLIDAKADVGAISETFKMTPLHWAASGAHIDIAKMLVEAGSPKNRISRQRVTPLELAKFKLKRIQDGVNHLGAEFSSPSEKTELIKKYSAFVEYLEAVPGVVSK